MELPQEQDKLFTQFTRPTLKFFNFRSEQTANTQFLIKQLRWSFFLKWAKCFLIIFDLQDSFLVKLKLI